MIVGTVHTYYRPAVEAGAAGPVEWLSFLGGGGTIVGGHCSWAAQILCRRKIAKIFWGLEIIINFVETISADAVNIMPNGAYTNIFAGKIFEVGG